MGKKNVKPMFSLTRPAVEFRQSSIAGRGVIAKRAFAPGEVIVPYAPVQRRLAVNHPDAVAAAASKVTLLADGGNVVVIPDTRTPGGWLCNHSCHPNATLFTSGAGRIQCSEARSCVAALIRAARSISCDTHVPRGALHELLARPQA